MDTQLAIDAISKTMYFAILIVTPMLGAGLLIGLIVAIFQSVTQIQEMTLTFIPKMLVMALVFMYSLTWMVQKVMDLTVEMFNNIMLP